MTDTLNVHNENSKIDDDENNIEDSDAKTDDNYVRDGNCQKIYYISDIY